MVLENIAKLAKNKCLRNSLLILSTFFVLSGTDFLFNKKTFAQTYTNKTSVGSLEEKIENEGIEFDNVELQESAVRIFLDVPHQYHDYIKNEVPFVNYVRDRKQAQVHLLMTMQKTGSGGTEYTMTFIGQQDFIDMDDTLKYASKKMDTREITRSGLVNIIKMGLVPYVAKTPLADYISIIYNKKAEPTTIVDKWDYWVFNIGSNTFLNGEESMKKISVSGSFSADRVTPNWKISQSLRTSYDESKFKTGESTISSFTRSHTYQGLIVKSLGEHWSIGGYCSARSSIYNNTKLSFNLAPAVEYNVFPYSESTRKEFRFLYRVGNTNIRYNEETIYDKMRENLFSETLSATLELKERWGSVSSTLVGSHYFHDFSKKRLTLYTNLSLPIFEGFSLNLFGSASKINDQLSLPKEGATEEEILLHRKQLATQYDYSFSIGLQYTFGSIYSNVVNPRFGSQRMRRAY